MRSSTGLAGLSARLAHLSRRVQPPAGPAPRCAIASPVATGSCTVHASCNAQGAPWTRASPLMRAVLYAGPGCGGVDMRRRMVGLPGFDLRTIDVTRRWRSRCAGRIRRRVHEVLTLSTDQVTVLEGIPIVRPERLMLELRATSPLARRAGARHGVVEGALLRRLPAADWYEEPAGRAVGNRV